MPRSPCFNFSRIIIILLLLLMLCHTHQHRLRIIPLTVLLFCMLQSLEYRLLCEPSLLKEEEQKSSTIVSNVCLPV
jgi:hypothetical protein